ncbi:MAG: (4Fe-4S)-binding protein [Deltaproteobacteria bacterium]|nr:MAG: (4Fe-4S)-binding protein [Deltaproteobacteria bacterium]
MKENKKMKTIKEIRVDVNKCNGCLSCEMSCSAAHAMPPYTSVNPARSRISVVMDETKDVYIPIRAGDYAEAECAGRNQYTIDGKEYDTCLLCPASCPSRSRFTEPDSGLPLKCDMCESLDIGEPMCVQVCHPGALSYHEYQVEAEDSVTLERGEKEIGLEYLVKRYGLEEVVKTVATMAKKSA